MHLGHLCLKVGGKRGLAGKQARTSKTVVRLFCMEVTQPLANVGFQFASKSDQRTLRRLAQGVHQRWTLPSPSIHHYFVRMLRDSQPTRSMSQTEDKGASRCPLQQSLRLAFIRFLALLAIIVPIMPIIFNKQGCTLLPQSSVNRETRAEPARSPGLRRLHRRRCGARSGGGRPSTRPVGPGQLGPRRRLAVVGCTAAFGRVGSDIPAIEAALARVRRHGRQFFRAQRSRCQDLLKAVEGVTWRIHKPQ